MICWSEFGYLQYSPRMDDVINQSSHIHSPLRKPLLARLTHEPTPCHRRATGPHFAAAAQGAHVHLNAAEQRRWRAHDDRVGLLGASFCGEVGDVWRWMKCAAVDGLWGVDLDRVEVGKWEYVRSGISGVPCWENGVYEFECLCACRCVLMMIFAVMDGWSQNSTTHGLTCEFEFLDPHRRFAHSRFGFEIGFEQFVCMRMRISDSFRLRQRAARYISWICSVGYEKYICTVSFLKGLPESGNFNSFT